ncbi:DUF6048 family protein [Dokdonia sp. Asnod3-C12]|uniref:DUF6048 family protein n=1 Tax=Dokdonia sp. Asnod3-C12 TaxID=3160575 RepID=UPI003865ADA3
MIKLKHIFLFFTSIILTVFTSSLRAQKTSIENTASDSITAPTDYYGLRLGVDISKPIRSFLDDNYKGLELVADFRLKKNYYVAAEIGNETWNSDLPNLENTTSGSYIKAGFNYNTYENWFGMNNLIYAGVRAGFSSFSQELESYTIYTTNPVFGDDTRSVSQEFKGLNATWLELKIGLEVELFSNIYLGVNAQLKRTITTTDPDGYSNLYIPGFGELTEGTPIGVGYGYTLSYLIPIFKK